MSKILHDDDAVDDDDDSVMTKPRRLFQKQPS